MSVQLREFTSASTPAGMAAQVGQLALPFEPTSIAETGLSMGFLTDLALKVVYFHGNISAQQISEVTKLPFMGVLDKVLDFLKLEEYIDIIGSDGSFNERGFQYVVMPKGRIKVEEVLARTQYAGPAPVPLAEYVAMVKRQAMGELIVDTRTVRDAFTGLVVNDRMLDKIGPAANSARSLFLYGPPGNGKTTIAEGIANMLGGYIILPYAIEVDGQIIKMYDPLNHRIVE
ncbi:MAG: AAA family ATPase, partial [Roseiflexaceae bacterium]